MNKKKKLRALLKRLQDLQARADEAGVDAEEIQEELAEVEAAIAALEDAVDTVEETADEAAAEGEEARADEDEDEDKKDEAEERKSIAKARRSVREKLQRRAMADGSVQARSLSGMASAKPVVPGADSKEYRSAFFKNLMGRDMNARERAAFVHTTANTSAVLPTETLNEIWDLVTGQHAIMGDIRILQSGTTIEVIKHTAVTQGNATTVNENAANQDETNTFVKVTLAGKDFSKHIDVTYALERMSVEAFESYIVNEIAALGGDAGRHDRGGRKDRVQGSRAGHGPAEARRQGVHLRKPRDDLQLPCWNGRRPGPPDLPADRAGRRGGRLPGCGRQGRGRGHRRRPAVRGSVQVHV